MSEAKADFDWAASRGEKWREQLGAMEAMLAPIDEPLIDALQLDAPYRIADVACGGGGTTLEVLRRAPHGSVVHGFDISPALIESARARFPERAHALTFALADVATVAAPAAPYERLVSRFGTMFFDEPAAAFGNLLHWLAPGGRFAFAVWGRPTDNPMGLVREVAATFVEMPMPDPAAPGPFRYANVDPLLTLLTGAGFADLAVQEWRGPLQIGGGLPPESAAEFALNAFSIGEQVARAGTEAFAAVRQALSARFVDHVTDGVVQLGASVHLVTGRR